MKKQQLFIGLISLLLFVFTLGNYSVHADMGRNISDHITNLEISDRDRGKQDTYQHGAYLNVKGTFSDQRGEIHGGDYILVNWSTQSENAHAFLQGFNGKKDLYIDGTMVATYTVDATGAKLLFNDNVNNLQNINGSFTFTVQAFNDTSNNQVLNIGSGTVNVDVTMQAGASDGHEIIHHQSWAGSKTGAVQSYAGKNWVNWGVYFNSNAADLTGQITFTDQIPAGLSLDPNRINIWLDGTEYIPLADFKARFPQSAIKVEGSVITATFAGTEFSGHSFSLGYLTEITDPTAVSFTNTATGSYQLAGQTPQNYDFAATVRNVNFDASVTGTKPGELKIIKYYDENGSRKLLPGVTFEITAQTGKKWQATTDAHGVISLKNMIAGTYFVREIAAPDWINLDEVRNRTWQVAVLSRGEGQALEIVNHKKPAPEEPANPGEKEPPAEDNETSKVPGEKDPAEDTEEVEVPNEKEPAEDPEVPMNSDEKESPEEPRIPANPNEIDLPKDPEKPALPMVPELPLIGDQEPALGTKTTGKEIGLQIVPKPAEVNAAEKKERQQQATAKATAATSVNTKLPQTGAGVSLMVYGLIILVGTVLGFRRKLF